MKRLACLLLIGAGLAGAVGAALLVLPRTAEAAPDYTGFHAFIDRDGSTYFAFTLDSVANPTGSIALGVKGLGLVGSGHDVSFDIHSPQSMKITFDGIGALDTAAKLDFDFGLNQPSAQTTPVEFRLNGQVDLSHNTCSVRAWINGQHYNVIGKRPSKAPDKALSDFLGALQRSSWGAVYDMSAPVFQQNISRADFVAQATSLWQSTVGPGSFTIHLDGPPVLGDGRSGVWTATTTFEVAGSQGSPAYTVTLAWENGAWRLLDVQPVP
jgi:hypothetical protein